MPLTASMAHAEVNGVDDMQVLQGQVVGPSAWREVTQEMINEFAELTGDDQWIHVDVERAARESPFGTTIAHGNLTLSLIDGLRKELSSWGGAVKMGVNYGFNKVRFPAPVPVGSRLRCYTEIVEVTDVGGGWHQVVTRVTVESDGGEKPVCVAESVGRVFVDDAS